MVWLPVFMPVMHSSGIHGQAYIDGRPTHHKPRRRDKLLMVIFPMRCLPSHKILYKHDCDILEGKNSKPDPEMSDFPDGGMKCIGARI